MKKRNLVSRRKSPKPRSGGEPDVRRDDKKRARGGEELTYQGPNPKRSSTANDKRLLEGQRSPGKKKLEGGKETHQKKDGKLRKLR